MHKTNDIDCGEVEISTCCTPGCFEIESRVKNIDIFFIESSNLICVSWIPAYRYFVNWISSVWQWYYIHCHSDWQYKIWCLQKPMKYHVCLFTKLYKMCFRVCFCLTMLTCIYKRCTKSPQSINLSIDQQPFKFPSTSD